MLENIIYSFIVDLHPKFAHQAWHLAKSLLRHCGARPEDIHIQMAREVSDEIGQIFCKEGYLVHPLSRFGDGKWCNKIAQIPNLLSQQCDRIVLLDTDMIAVGDIRPYLQGNCVQAKVVDLPNPDLQVLLEIMSPFYHGTLPVMLTDASDQETIIGNANGGFYAVPWALAEQFCGEWRKWALWLLNENRCLHKVERQNHIDQVSAAMAFQLSGVPYGHIPSNVNYFMHFRGDHRYYDADSPICLIHYHDQAMNAEGAVAPQMTLTAAEAEAVAEANRQILQDMHEVLLKRYAASRSDANWAQL